MSEVTLRLSTMTNHDDPIASISIKMIRFLINNCDDNVYNYFTLNRGAKNGEGCS